MRKGRFCRVVLWDEFHLALWRNGAGQFLLTDFGKYLEVHRYEVVELLRLLGVDAELFLGARILPRGFDMSSRAFTDEQRRALLEFFRVREGSFRRLPKGFLGEFSRRGSFVVPSIYGPGSRVFS